MGKRSGRKQRRVLNAAGHIRCGYSSGIEAGGDIKAGGGIKSRMDIEAGGGIKAGGGIEAGRGIKAGLGVECKLELKFSTRLFAGTSAGAVAATRSVICGKLGGRGKVSYGDVEEIAGWEGTPEGDGSPAPWIITLPPLPR